MRVETNDKHRWIEVQNPEGVESINVSHAFGDTASVQVGDRLGLIAESETDVLVCIVNKPPTGGACAPNGTVFFIAKQEYDSMTRNYETEMARILAGKAKVSCLLRGAEAS